MLAFCLGILVWQIVTLVVFLVTNQNEEKGAICGCLIPFAILYGVCAIIRKVINLIRHKNIRSVLICPDGKWRYCKSQYSSYLEYNGYNFPRWNDELKNKYPRTLWNTKYLDSVCCFDVGNLRYSPKTVWQGLEEISLTEIAIAKIEYDKKEYE